MTDTVVIMAKYPEPGRVKTRLAATVGAAAACDLYRAFLVDLSQRMSGGRWEVVWAMSPSGSRLDDILGGPPARAIDQRGESLGPRMHNCFADLFVAGASRVVMIGADAPQLSAETIDDVLEALREADIALVPSHDGGYCLVAMRTLHDVFSTIEMGTDRVLSQTRRLCAERGLTVTELAAQFDIDEIADVRRLASEITAGLDLSATAAVLDRWRREGLL